MLNLGVTPEVLPTSEYFHPTRAQSLLSLPLSYSRFGPSSSSGPVEFEDSNFDPDPTLN